MSSAANPRRLVVISLFIGIALVMLGKLFFLQLVEDKYKVMANDIAIYRKVVYPPRGVIYDRNNKVMLYNQVAYDLMVTPSSITKDLDTNHLCRLLDWDKETFEKTLQKLRYRNGYRRKSVLVEQLTQAQTARFQENLYLFPGFDLSERYMRSYPDSIAGLMLGYIGEVSAKMLQKDRYKSYQQGDYVGINGLENSYEEVLRGQRGVYFLERDNFNRPTEPYMKGALDTQAVAGRSLQLYLDADLQAYGERLMQHKLGSIVAIDPSTGGILAMVSAPSYDPNLLKGRDRAKNFSKMYLDATKPMFNRAIQASYQPGSTMKPLTALVALDKGVITPNFGYPCAGGYYGCGKRIGCTHSGGGHAANLRRALANSCNAYFVHIMRMVIDDKQYKNVKTGFQNWHDYFTNFALGRPTGVDLPYEGSGLLPDTAMINRMYRSTWNSCMVLFNGMGQGEVALTPIQLANAMCVIANKGYYYIPHFVRAINNNPKDTVLSPYLKKNVVSNISSRAFDEVSMGMQDVVEYGTGKVAQLPGIEVCAKTGTVENKARVGSQIIKMKDHSVFVAFAPRENPKIAIAVIVENAGYGATWAGPIASLMMERYLNDTIATNRKHLEQKMYNANLVNQYIYDIDSTQRAMDRMRYERRQLRQQQQDSLQRAEDSTTIMNWFRKTYLKDEQ